MKARKTFSSEQLFPEFRFADVRSLILVGVLVWLTACASTGEFESAPPVVSEPVAATPPPAPVEEIVITESRIVRRDQLNSPLVTTRSDAIQELNRRARGIYQQRHQPIEIEEPMLLRPVDASMVFKNYGVNPTVSTLQENATTFSVDVDTASYTIAKGFLDNRTMPDANGIRVEEFVNSLDYGYTAPREQKFSLQAEVFPSPFRRGFHVLHLGIKGQDFTQVEEKNTNLTLLIDVSGSMAGGNRLELLKQGLEDLLDAMDKDDTVTIVVYSTNARLLLEATGVRNKRRIRNAIETLRPEESTNIEAGLELAYRMANKAFDPERNNRIVLCSDGVANVGHTNATRMMNNVSDAAKHGIYLNTVGIGMGNYNDVTLEELAKQGQGHYAYVNTLEDAKKLFNKQLLRNLQILARDVRIQVEFDPLFVESYRLLGYENRGMANEDFNNAKKDAGEVGVGHAVTAIYEIKFRRFEEGANTSARQQLGHHAFGVFRLNYKPLDNERLYRIEHTLPSSIIANDQFAATENAQLSYIAAAFAEKLRGSYWSRLYSYQDLISWLHPITHSVADVRGARELESYLRIAGALDNRGDLYTHLGPINNMDFDRVPVLGNK